VFRSLRCLNLEQAEYKQKFGKDWVAGATPAAAPAAKAAAPAAKAAAPAAATTPAVAPASAGGDDATLSTAIAAKGEQVRKLKADKADKATVEPVVKELLALKVRMRMCVCVCVCVCVCLCVCAVVVMGPCLFVCPGRPM
jgi:hypothetical protein